MHTTRNLRRARLAIGGVVALVSVVAATLALSACEPVSALPVSFASRPIAADMVDGEGLAVLQVGSTLYVGGTFTTVRNQAGATVAARANLAAFDIATGHLRPGFRADTNGPVRALATDGRRLFVGGSYTTVNSSNRSRLASVDLATGAVDSSFVANVNSNVYSLARFGDRLAVGGSFSTIAQQPRDRFAVVSTLNGAVQATSATFGRTINAVGATPDGSRLFVGGSFSAVNGVSQPYAAVLTSTGALAPVQLRNLNGPPSAFVVSDDGAFVYASLQGAPNSGNRWRVSDGARQWATYCDGDAQAIDEYAGTTYTGFHEACDGDATVRLVANDSVSGARDAAFRPAFDRYWGVRSIDAGPAGLAVAGDFTSIAGVPAQGFVIFPPLHSTPPTTTTTTTTTTTLPPTTTTTTRPPTTTTTTTTTTPPTTTTTAPPAGNVGFPIAEQAGTWRYWDGTAAPAAGWNGTAFADSSWKFGTAELGYGDGDEHTVISFGPDPKKKTITAYFRRSFTLGSLPARLRLLLTADDGAVVYLNGVEVLRDNMPTGTITSTTRAASNRGAANESDPRAFTVTAGALRIGTNVVAVEVHQDDPTSSDLSFDLGVSPG